MCICPTRNLVSNIGFGANSTNTRNRRFSYANVARHEMAFPLIAPESHTIDAENDIQIAKMMYTPRFSWKGLARAVLVTLLGEARYTRMRMRLRRA